MSYNLKEWCTEHRINKENVKEKKSAVEGSTDLCQAMDWEPEGFWHCFEVFRISQELGWQKIKAMSEVFQGPLSGPIQQTQNILP